MENKFLPNYIIIHGWLMEFGRKCCCFWFLTGRIFKERIEYNKLHFLTKFLNNYYEQSDYVDFMKKISYFQTSHTHPPYHRPCPSLQLDEQINIGWFWFLPCTPAGSYIQGSGVVWCICIILGLIDTFRMPEDLFKVITKLIL